MKKYITLAALLSAGAAFANAEEVTQNFSFTEASSTVPLTTPVDLTQNWTLEFTLAPFDPTTVTWVEGDVLVSLGGLSVAMSPYTGTLSNPNDAQYYSTIKIMEESGAWEKSGAFNWGKGPTSSAGAVFTLEYVDETLTVKATYEWVFNGVVFDAGTYYSETYTDVTFNETNATSLSSSISAVGVPIPTGKITSTVIPEPSAFGLLAGLGALALVGTRRRRK